MIENDLTGQVVERQRVRLWKDLRFKYRAGQTGHSVANGSPPLRQFFERSCVARWRNYAKMVRKYVTRFA